MRFQVQGYGKLIEYVGNM